MSQNKEKSTFKFNPIIVSGATGVGVVFGLVTGQLVTGIALGAGIGLIINLFVSMNANKK